MMDFEYQPYGYLIERTAKSMKQYLQRKFNEGNLGITVDQWLVLDVLHQSNGISQYEIAKRTYKDAPTVTRIIDLLGKKQLVQRETNPNDRRRFNISLTKEGKEKVANILPIVQEYRRLGWSGLSEPDYTKLREILGIIQRNFKEEGGSSSP